MNSPKHENRGLTTYKLYTRELKESYPKSTGSRSWVADEKEDVTRI